MTSIINCISLFILPLEAIVMPHLLTDIHLIAFDRLVYREIKGIFFYSERKNVSVQDLNGT